MPRDDVLRTLAVSACALAVGVAIGVVCVNSGRSAKSSTDEDASSFWTSIRGVISLSARETSQEAEAGGVSATHTTKVDVPANAPEHCPGVESEAAGKVDACKGCPNQGICASGAVSKPDPKIQLIAEKLKTIKHKIVILSGKGGVGKSTLSAQIAWGLNKMGASVGLLDVDICGPSIPRMTGTLGASVQAVGEGWAPVFVKDDFEVMSVGYLLPGDDDAVIWRGPKKNGLISQFLTDVCWGELDFLIVDTPPGTTDEHLSLVNYLKEAKIDGAILVTTSQEVALQDVRKEINFCKRVGLPVIGVVENMSGGIFEESNRGGAEAMCIKMGVPYVGQLRMSATLLTAGENGVSVFESSDENTKSELMNLMRSCLLNANIDEKLWIKDIKEEKETKTETTADQEIQQQIDNTETVPAVHQLDDSMEAIQSAAAAI